MLDAAHRLALRAVAQGNAEADSPALRNLAIAGLVTPIDGAWALTQTGHAVLQLEEPAEGSGGGTNDIMSKVRDWFMT